MSNKNIILISVSVIILIIIGTISFYFGKRILGKEKNIISSSDAVVYYALRSAKAAAALDGSTGGFNSSDMETLKNVVKKINPNNQWFSDNTGTFYVNTADTSDMKVTWISDGNYCATFYCIETKDNKGWTKIILKNYTFTTETKKGYKIFIN